MAQYVLAGEARTLLFDTGMPYTPAEALAPVPRVDRARARGGRRRPDQPRRPRPLRRQPRAARAPSAARASPATSSTAAGSSRTRRSWPRTTSGTRRTASTSPTRPAARSSRRCAAATRRSTRGCAAARRSGSRTDWRVEVLHLPGHTLGHIGLWDPRSRAAIVIDAVLERGDLRERRRAADPTAGLRPGRVPRTRSGGSARSSPSSCSPPTTR